MTSRRVFSSTAECAISTLYHGPRPRLGLTHPAELAVPARVCRGWGCFKLRHIHTSPPQCRSWKVSPPQPPSIHPHSSTSPDEVVFPMSEQLRHMMRLLTHSVVICTSVSGTSPRAMTMSSFTSLSLDPPVVTFHVATPSRTLDAIRESGRLNVHILAGDVHGAKVADWFTRGNIGGKVWKTEDLERVGVTIKSKNLASGKVPPEPPVLSGKGVLYVLKCKLLDEAHDGVVMVRDHAIVLGEVLEIVEGGARSEPKERFGLVYTDRRYRQLGNTLVKITAKDDTNG